MKVSGIYKIRNLVNGREYIGSTINFETRWKSHKNYLKNGNHKNCHLQSAWNKYGKDNFIFEPIKEVSSENLIIEEQKLLDSSDFDKLYNISIFADNPTRGRKLSESHRKNLSKPKSSTINMSIAARKRFEDPEQREFIKQIGLRNKGKKYNCDRRGPNSSTAKLTIDQVRMIRQMYVPYKVTPKKLAKIFNCSTHAVENIVQNRSWTNV